jgi:hypothetical protein
VSDRRATLRAALGFLAIEPREPELRLLHRWLDSWPGIGHVTAGMARHDYDLRTPAPKDYAAPDLVTLDFGLFRSISSAQT